MAWARIDDNFFNHPKVRKAGKDAIIFHVAALCHSNAFTTDGFIADEMLELIAVQAFHRRADGYADRLVDCDLWERVEGGYIIHDFLKYNHSKTEVEEIRTKKSAAGKQGGRPIKANEKQTESKPKANDEAKIKVIESHTHPIYIPIKEKEVVDISSSSLTDPFIDAYHKATGIEPKKTEEEKAMIQRFTKLGILPTEYQKAIQEMQSKGYKIASMLSAETWTMNNRNGKKAHKADDPAARLEMFKAEARRIQHSQGA